MDIGGYLIPNPCAEMLGITDGEKIYGSTKDFLCFRHRNLRMFIAFCLAVAVASVIGALFYALIKPIVTGAALYVIYWVVKNRKPKSPQDSQ